MNKVYTILKLALALFLIALQLQCMAEDKRERRLASKNSSYFIDPNHGDDSNIGTKKEKPWKTFNKLNALRLTEGNTVEILSSGTFNESLFLIGEGTQEAPITINFAPGAYQFFSKNAYKSRFHISNTNDDPKGLKAIALYVLNSKNIHIKGTDAEIVFRGKMMEAAIDNSENVIVEGLQFDYKRPTVSEMKIVSVADNYADLQVHPDSKYKIQDSVLYWIGEGWEHKVQTLWQVFDTEKQSVWRKNLSMDALHFEELQNNTLRVFFKNNPAFVKGHIYQNRNTFRDCAAFFTQKSKNILWKDVTVNFMHGMGRYFTFFRVQRTY